MRFLNSPYLLNYHTHTHTHTKERNSPLLTASSKNISSDTDAYQEEMISLKHNLDRNNYPERITSAPRNLDRKIEDNTRKLTTVCLPYVKGLAERTQKRCSPYDIRTVFNSPEISLPGQATNGIQHKQELCLLYPLQLW